VSRRSVRDGNEEQCMGGGRPPPSTEPCRGRVSQEIRRVGMFALVCVRAPRRSSVARPPVCSVPHRCRRFQHNTQTKEADLTFR
jgi:hypothetical protein